MDDSDTPPLIANFAGQVTCRQSDGVSPGLTLTGAAAESPGERLILILVGVTVPDLPPTLSSPSIEAQGGGCYRITSASGQWRVVAQAAYAYRDVGAAFRQMIPPRPVPWKKRLLLRVVLALAGNPAGRRMLRALRAPR